MTRAEELANEVQRLSRDELASFRDWFRKYESDEWDKEIEEDVLAGRLDTLASEAIADHKAGRTARHLPWKYELLPPYPSPLRPCLALQSGRHSGRAMQRIARSGIQPSRWPLRRPV